MGIDTPEDVMVLLGESFEQGGLLLSEHKLGENFFDLGTGQAGELFQKFVNYRQKLAIVVKDLSSKSERVQELASEHRQHPWVRFFSSEQEGRDWLAE